MPAPAHGAFTLRAIGALSRLHLPGRSDGAHLDLLRLMSLSSDTRPTHHATWCRSAGVDGERVATVWVENLSGLCRLLGRVNPSGSCATKTINRHLAIWAEHELAAMRGGVLFIFTPHIIALDPHARRDERQAPRIDWRWGGDQPALDLVVPEADPQGIDPQGITTPLYRDHVCIPPTPRGADAEIERFVESCIPDVADYPRRRLSDAERDILAELVAEHGEDEARSVARDVCPGKLYPVRYLGKALARRKVEAAAGVPERRPQAQASASWSAQPSDGARRRARGRRRGNQDVGRDPTTGRCVSQVEHAVRRGHRELIAVEPPTLLTRCASVEPAQSGACRVSAGAEACAVVVERSERRACPEASAVWAERSAGLRAQLTDENWRTYFEPMVPIGMDGDELVLAARDAFFRAWVVAHYQGLLRDAGVRVEARGELPSARATMGSGGWSGWPGGSPDDDFDAVWEGVQRSNIDRDRAASGDDCEDEVVDDEARARAEVSMRQLVALAGGA